MSPFKNVQMQPYSYKFCRSFICVLFAYAIMTLGGLAQGTLYVAPTGSDATGNGTIGNPYRTISNGVLKAQNYDTVMVATGTYNVTVNIVLGKPITVRSWNEGAGGAEDRTATIIDGGGSCAPLYVNHAEALFGGFTIINGNGVGGSSSVYGGGVYMNGGTLSNCIVCYNNCANFGGGVYMVNGAMVNDCLILSNHLTSVSVGYGGGICVAAGCKVFNTDVIGNTNYNHGGGIYCNENTVISNCLVAENTVTYSGGGLGGGIEVAGTNVFIQNSVISNNYSRLTGGGVGVSAQGLLTMLDCTVTDNRAGTLGGGIHFMRTAYGKGAFISNSVISRNYVIASGASGSGLADGYTTGATSFGMLTVANTRFIGNGGTTSDRCGGGAWIYTHGTAAFHNCQFVGNSLNGSSGGGAGLYIGTGSACVVVRNCLFASNQVLGATGYGGGILLSSVSGATPGPNPLQVTVESCTITANSATYDCGGMNIPANVSGFNCVVVSNLADHAYPDLSDSQTAIGRFHYSCSPALTNPANGNITNYPEFINHVGGNYRLQEISPCINAGTNVSEWMAGALDLDGRPRIDRFGRRVDMGVYEHLPEGILFMSK